jgi:uncharacterized membrane-anchored protein YhcB (DUF1043 family)
MIWLTAIGCLAVGIIIGVVFTSRLNTSPARVQELENQIRTLKESHNSYRDNVSDHFSMTAELFQHMTESYKEVYQHLATGAQELCSHEVASKLLPARSDSVFDNDSDEDDSAVGLSPPKDYATKQNPGQKGALSEDFGIDKPRSADDEESSPQQTH